MGEREREDTSSMQPASGYEVTLESIELWFEPPYCELPKPIRLSTLGQNLHKRIEGGCIFSLYLFNPGDKTLQEIGSNPTE
jgi:hypothetical protein